MKLSLLISMLIISLNGFSQSTLENTFSMLESRAEENKLDELLEKSIDSAFFLLMNYPFFNKYKIDIKKNKEHWHPISNNVIYAENELGVICKISKSKKSVPCNSGIKCIPKHDTRAKYYSVTKYDTVKCIDPKGRVLFE